MCRICHQATGHDLYVDHTGGGYVHCECLMQERDAAVTEVALLTSQLRTSNHSLVSFLTGIEILVKRGRLVLTTEEQAFVDRCHDAVFVKVEIEHGAALGEGRAE